MVVIIAFLSSTSFTSSPSVSMARSFRSASPIRPDGERNHEGQQGRRHSASGLLE